MKVYRIGRDPEADIVVSDRSVSSRHAELVDAGDGSFDLVDCGSKNGCFRRSGGKWIEHRRGVVAAREPIMLGSFRTTAEELLSMVRGGRSTAQPAGRGVRRVVERDPLTGEIIKR